MVGFLLFRLFYTNWRICLDNVAFNNFTRTLVDVTDNSEQIQNIHESKFFLNDGSTYTQYTGEIPVIVANRNGKQIKYEFFANKTSRFSILGKNQELPVFTSKINDTEILNDVYNYQWDGNSFKYEAGMPSVWLSSGNAVLNAEKENKMTFTLSQKPQNVKAYCKRVLGKIVDTYPIKYSNNINLKLTDDNTIALPKELGDYYIVVKAKYQTDWVEYAAFFEIQ